MSIKIYNGYKLNLNKIGNTIYDLYNFIENLKHQIKIKTDEIYTNRVNVLITDMLADIIVGRHISCSRTNYIKDDLISYTSQIFDCSLLKIADSTISNHLMINKYSKTRHYLDLDFSIVLFPIPEENELLITLYTENNILRKTFEDNQLITEYSYFNNADKPKSLSDDDWDRREYLWCQKIFKENHTPAEKGWTIEVSSYPYPKVNSSDVLKHIDSVNNLLQQTAERIARIQKLDSYENNDKVSAYKQLKDMQTWLDTEDFKITVKTIKNNLELYLPVKLTKDMIDKPIKESLPLFKRTIYELVENKNNYNF
ncbi:MAG: hypothetical protein PHD05_00195 [Sphaerochaetaceae bacterium]|jgi:hypothetical protein|nr:hypothetical protein [Sphaerochaetaceae bacterium]